VAFHNICNAAVREASGYNTITFGHWPK
jgi:hypothetical protein